MPTAPPLRKYWTARFGTAPFLPMSRAEMDALGWDSCAENEPNAIVLLTSIHALRLTDMDIEFVRQGIRFVAGSDKARRTLRKHGVSFERAAEAFFDPFLKVLDASRNDEARNAILGMDEND